MIWSGYKRGTNGSGYRPGSLLASLASLGSLIAALSCCLPLGSLLFAAGSATASAFAETLRPYLLSAAVLLLVFAFVQTYRTGRCEFRHRRIRTVLLWFTGVAVAGMIALPVQFATLVAGAIPSGRNAQGLRTFTQGQFVQDFDSAVKTRRLVVLLSPT